MSLQHEPLELLQQLVRIDSQNPPGNSKEIIFFIREYLKQLHIPFSVYEVSKNRFNLVCTVRSKNARKKILFAPHVDTVPATGRWRFSPFGGVVYRGRLYGRGTTDCKVNVAAALYLIKRLKLENTRLNNLDLVFAFCGDEETGSKFGIIPLMKVLKNIDYGIVLDANEFNIVVAQKGLLHLRVEFFGKEAHGAYPHRGINAIVKAIAALEEIVKHGFLRKRPHPILKKPTLNIGRFIGGDKVNIVAGSAFFELDIRYLPSMDKNEIIRDIERIARKKGKYKVKILAHQGPIEIPRDSFSLNILRGVLRAKKIHSRLIPSFGATVINFLKARGIETFAFGFGTKGCAHTKDEYVKVDNLYKGIEVLCEYVKKLDKKLENEKIRARIANV
ncbi:MAG: M20/M25/M40 family metallo-hydrolase [Candidatus Omnitrophota bacterium]|nr:MAG: M20/M25/M40 family metallo-hydrolase [Candidatus Omnitrophota bacterium]